MEQTEIATWILDSGATSHMVGSLKKFTNISETNQRLNLASKSTAEIKGIGTAKLTINNNGRSHRITLNDALYVPDLRVNLLSVSKICDRGNQVVFEKNAAYLVEKSGRSITLAKREENLYYIEEIMESAATTAPKSKISDWHERLGHLNENSLKELKRRRRVFGLNFDESSTLPKCEICIQGKQAQKPFPKKSASRCTELLELVHSDVCGPMRVQSIGGKRYFVTFIDDASRWGAVYFLKGKNEVFEAFQDFKNLAECQLKRRLKILRTDNGTEYCNNEFKEYLRKNGIRHQLTVEYTPQQNGVAERKNRTLIEMARCMLLQASLPPSYWAEAISTANYIRNRCPSRSLGNNIPEKIWSGKKPTLSHLQTFGVKAFALDKTPNKGKFEPRSHECIFLGYETESKAYRLWSTERQTIIKSRDVVFTNEFKYKGTPQDFDYRPTNVEICTKTLTSTQNQETQTQGEQEEHKEKQQITESATSQSQRGRGRPKIQRNGTRGRPKKVYNTVPSDPPHEEESDQTKIEEACICDENDPRTAKEAMAGPDANEWRAAMKSEYASLLKNNTWTLVDPPTNAKVIQSKWIFKTKYKADGSIEKRKARLVAKGYTQRAGIDYQETFAPVVRSSSLRFVMALAAQLKMEVHQLDVETAYLNGDLEETIYLQPPEMLTEISEQKDALPPGKVCLLNKSIYGLKQSGRQWYKKLDDRLLQLGMKHCSADPCIYIRRNNGELTIIAVYVDDIVLASTNQLEIERIKNILKDSFKMKDLGRIHHCLGIEFAQRTTTKSISMSQKGFIKEILSRFGMEDCKPVKTPMDPNSKLSMAMSPQNPEELKEMENCPYQNLIGSLMYLAVSTRPDIAYAVSALSQYNTSPGKEHWIAAKRVLRYLKGTMDFELIFKQSDEGLIGYADADWGANIDDRKSYTGYTFLYAGGPITWEARKQRTVALSTTEAEYMALSDATKEAIHLRRFLRETTGTDETVKIHCDNQGAQRLARNPVFHNRTKHIDIRYHFIREAVEKKDIDLEYIPTERMLADILTKSLFAPRQEALIKELGMRQKRKEDQTRIVGEVLEIDDPE